jgi:hypothetical protein
MSGKKAAGCGKEPTVVVADDPEDRKGALEFVGGSQSDSWNNLLANQAVQALWLANSDRETRDRQYSATVAGLIGVGPRDELEGMLAAQMLALLPSATRMPSGTGVIQQKPSLEGVV